jgi:hypothetical protein
VGDNSALGTFVLLGYGFAALLMVFQIVIVVLNISKSHTIWENIGPLIYRLLLISILMSAPVYNLVFRYAITGTTDMMANAIYNTYAHDFLTSWKNVFKSGGDMETLAWGILTSSFSSSLVSNIVATLIFLAAVVCVFVVTMLQPLLWLFCFYTGPICLAFAVCDVTTHVAKNWLNMYLVVSFVGVFGSISFAVAQAAGIIQNFSVGTTGNNVILVAVYGIMAIIMFCLIWPLTGYLFGGNSPIGNTATPQAAISAAATGAIVYGAGMAGMGTLLAKMSGGNANSVLSKIAGTMQSHGKLTMNKADTVSRLLHGQPPIDSSKSNQQKGSKQEKPTVPE